MKKPYSTALADIKRQLDASPWLKVALGVIFVLSAIALVQLMESARDATQQRAIKAEADLRRVRALQGQEEWIARAEDSKKIQEALQAEIPLTSTPGIAQAGLQSWLNDLIGSAGKVQGPRIAVDNAVPVETMPGVLRVRGTLSGGMPPRQALNILRQIESAKNLVVVETIDIRNDGNQVFSVSINAYYRLSEQGATP